MHQPSPYTPGEMAREIPGRGPQLQAIGGLFSRVADQHDFAGRIRVETGPRGVGKTSLLRKAQHLARSRNLATVFVTAGNGALTAVIADEIEQLTSTWTSRDALGEWLENAKVTFKAPGFLDVQLTRRNGIPAEATRAFRDLITHAAQSAVDDGKAGIALFIDELQSADEASLRTLAYAWQELQTARPPVPAVAIAAGLTHTPDVVTNAITHAERFKYSTLRDLDPPEAREALTTPATELGVSWSTQALQAVVERAQGYPYFIQLYGDQVWHAANNPAPGTTLTMTDVETAQPEVDVDLTALYRTRWSKATPKEREILTAMAHADKPLVERKAIAAALGVESTALSMARHSLIDKGIVHAPEHGFLAFTVPGFAQYILDVS